jgi:hypothetical protein
MRYLQTRDFEALMATKMQVVVLWTVQLRNLADRNVGKVERLAVTSNTRLHHRHYL